jgi:U4/U6.U5 tri-snRNP-associated protein 3
MLQLRSKRDGKDRKKKQKDKDKRKDRPSSRGEKEAGQGKADEEEEENGKAGGINLTADMTPEELQMMQAMGIPFSFDTTQGKMVRWCANTTTKHCQAVLLACSLHCIISGNISA